MKVIIQITTHKFLGFYSFSTIEIIQMKNTLPLPNCWLRHVDSLAVKILQYLRNIIIKMSYAIQYSL